MRKVLLIRTIQCDDGTFGHAISGDAHFVSGEPEAPRSGNKGRIPPGKYLCKWEPYGKFQGYAVKGVPDFESVEIHIGNTEDNTRGCVLLGLRRGKIGDKEAVLDSGIALQRFNLYMNQEDFELDIQEAFDAS